MTNLTLITFLPLIGALLVVLAPSSNVKLLRAVALAVTAAVAVKAATRIVLMISVVDMGVTSKRAFVKAHCVNPIGMHSACRRQRIIGRAARRASQVVV